MNDEIQNGVNVSAYNRPIKIAYLVPYENDEHNNWILDAIFHESYTRWGGARTLIIPSNRDQFLCPEYEKWLELYDADFVYTYVDIEKPLIQKIHKLCCPIDLVKHESSVKVERWRDYLPALERRFYISSALSITTAFSPPRGFGQNQNYLTLLTSKLRSCDEDRVVMDNFGISHHTSHVTSAKPGLYNVHEYESVTDAFTKAGNGEVVTFAKLSARHSKAVKTIESHAWHESFALFVGDTCLDRINFWNVRNLMPEWPDTPCSIIVPKSSLEDVNFVKALCNFFNRNNELNSSYPKISLRSLSLEKEDLEKVKETLLQSKVLYSNGGVFIAENFKEFCLPTVNDFKNFYHPHYSDKSSFILRDNQTEIIAAEPEHFAYIPPHVPFLKRGQWSIELAIERHNSLSKFFGYVDKWELPRNWHVTRCFTTSQRTKVSQENLLVIVPSSEGFLFGKEKLKPELKYSVILPRDVDVLRAMVVRYIPYPEDDLRFDPNLESYKGIAISDKGQNLRGIISMIGSLDSAYAILTNKFWIETLEKFSQREANKRTGGMSCNEMADFLVQNAEYRNAIMAHVGQRIGTKYINANFKDTLELLVERKIFYQTYENRCSYCGYNNVITIDDIKKENECSICKTKFFTPIEPEWTFNLNSFVSTSLIHHSGLTTLWTIGFLHDNPLKLNSSSKDIHKNSFYYLPEVNLLDDDDNVKEEIDILCVIKGKFCAGEAKASVLQFIDKETKEINRAVIDKFAKKINLIKPDIALLSFATLCGNEKENLELIEKLIPELKKLIQHSIGDTKLHILIAENDDKNFFHYPLNLGFIGKRTTALMDNKKNPI